MKVPSDLCLNIPSANVFFVYESKFMKVKNDLKVQKVVYFVTYCNIFQVMPVYWCFFYLSSDVFLIIKMRALS